MISKISRFSIDFTIVINFIFAPRPNPLPASVERVRVRCFFVKNKKSKELKVTWYLFFQVAGRLKFVACFDYFWS
jgi:hypothetical protein